MGWGISCWCHRPTSSRESRDSGGSVVLWCCAAVVGLVTGGPVDQCPVPSAQWSVVTVSGALVAVVGVRGPRDTALRFHRSG